MTVIDPSPFYVLGVFAGAAVVTFLGGWLFIRVVEHFWKKKDKLRRLKI